MQIAVSIKNLNKDFFIGKKPIRILHSINAEIQMGKLTMFVGPSGCGKTTLILLISGILSATDGDIFSINYHLNDMSDYEKVIFRRKHIGFIFQQYNLLPTLTAVENAAIPLIAAGMLNKQAIARAHCILEQIGMHKQTEKLPHQLSGGQQQRVAIARALVHNPSLIICDEPTAALDAKTGQTVMQLLREIANDKNRTVLVVTHDNRIYHFADRILEMSDGKIIGNHRPEELIHKEKL